MGKNSAIQWCHHTFNPWWGCAKVSPACDHCYAETWAIRTGHPDLWSVDGKRRFFGDAHWREPHHWNLAAGAADRRERVFCASMADVFDNHPEVAPHRERLWELIRATPHLDWLLLTKRIGNAKRMLPQDVCERVWLGISVVTPEECLRDIPKLAQLHARVRFLSCEPLIEHVRPNLAPIHWVIVGGESGPKARACWTPNVRKLVQQCAEKRVPCFVKQLGAVVYDRNDAGFDGCEPQAWPSIHEENGRIEHIEEGYQGAPVRLRLQDRSGGDLNEWPEDLRVQEWPTFAALSSAA